MRKIFSEEIMQVIIKKTKNISLKLQSASQFSVVGADSWAVQCRRTELRRTQHGVESERFNDNREQNYSQVMSHN